MVNLGLIIGLGIVGFIIVIGTIYLVLKRQSYKFNFLLFSRDGKHVRLLKAKIVVDKLNKKVKKFRFKGSDRTVSVREPTTTWDGRPARQITIDDAGEYVYISDSYISETGVITKGEDGKEINGSGTKSTFKVQEMTPEERELIARQINDNKNQFGVINKSQLFSLFGMIAFGVLFIIGCAVVMINMNKLPGAILEVTGELKETTDNLVKANEIQQQTISALVEYAQATNSSGIVRELS